MRRIFHVVALLLGVSMVTHGVVAFMPGDPAEIIVTSHNDAPSAANIEAVRQICGKTTPGNDKRAWRTVRGRQIMMMFQSEVLAVWQLPDV